MKIVVFGANGKVGSKVVARLLADGHCVRAFIHSTSKLMDHPKLELIKGDVHQVGDVRAAVKGSDVVISALGSWGTSSKDILSSGMQTIIPAMKAAKIYRIISLTGAGAQDSVDQPNLLDRLSRPLLLLVAPKILRDGEQHIALLRASELSWTVIRSPVMLGGGACAYKLGHQAPTPWATITRDAVVTALIHTIKSDRNVQSAPFISRA